MQQIGLYIHYPFCKSLCPYCDFNSHISKNIDENNYISAYIKEIDYNLSIIDKEKTILKTIYFGGGTPSLMTSKMVKSIIDYVKQNINYDKNIEVSLEANPTSFEIGKFIDFQKSGVNRISLGCQSLNQNNLTILGRQHSAEEAISAIEMCKKYFEKFSVDFIYGVPNQTLEMWYDELHRIIQLGAKHLSLYSLTIEKGTEFFIKQQKKEMSFYDSEKIGLFYEKTNEILKKNNFIQYEISNYATNEEHFSKHNLMYWKIKDYIGIGAGAHGRITDKDNIRWETMTYHGPSKWLESLNNSNSAMQKIERIDKKSQILEILMMSLRTIYGIDLIDIKNRFNIDLLNEFNVKKLEELKSNNLLDYNDSYVILTDNGRAVLNSVVGYLK